MDLGKAFTYVFSDDNWIMPILVGGLILLIPFIGIFWLIGYMLACARRELNQNPDLLPGLEDFGARLSDGFKGFVITFVYALPAVLLSVLVGLLMAATGVFSSNGGDSMSNFALVMITLFTVCFIPLMILFGVLLQVLSFGGLAIFLKTDSVGRALNFREAYGYIAGHVGSFLILWLVQILSGFIGSLGSIFFGFGALFTTVYSQAMYGNYFGQLVARMHIPDTPATNEPSV
ncbi:MAG: DUF4013 domain-containing protein [Anaerolineales bacterium]|jgi:hypothetical protein